MVLFIPTKIIGMHAATCNRVVLVLTHTLNADYLLVCDSKLNKYYDRICKYKPSDARGPLPLRPKLGKFEMYTILISLHPLRPLAKTVQESYLGAIIISIIYYPYMYQILPISHQYISPIYYQNQGHISVI